MEMPKPGPEHARIAKLAGKWSGEEMMEPSPWGAGGAAFGRSEYRLITDGMAVTQDYQQEKEGSPAFHGHGVFTIDPNSRDVLWWWFDTMGFPPSGPARGRWEGDTLTLEKASPHGDARYVFGLSGDRLQFSIENRAPGQESYAVFMRGDYRRNA